MRFGSEVEWECYVPGRQAGNIASAVDRTRPGILNLICSYVERPESRMADHFWRRSDGAGCWFLGSWVVYRRWYYHRCQSAPHQGATTGFPVSCLVVLITPKGGNDAASWEDPRFSPLFFFPKIAKNASILKFPYRSEL